MWVFFLQILSIVFLNEFIFLYKKHNYDSLKNGFRLSNFDISSIEKQNELLDFLKKRNLEIIDVWTKITDGLLLSLWENHLQKLCEDFVQMFSKNNFKNIAEKIKIKFFKNKNQHLFNKKKIIFFLDKFSIEAFVANKSCDYIFILSIKHLLTTKKHVVIVILSEKDLLITST
jgi:hypothetical protein